MKPLERLVAAIDYPSDELTPEDGVLHLVVDGEKIDVREEEGRIVFSCTLGDLEDSGLRRLAGYAAGRMLKEDAVLAWDPSTNGLMLWQDAPAAASDLQLKRVFEVFCASCDWWLARAGEEKVSEGHLPEMMIRP